MAYGLVAVSVLILRYQAEQVGFTEADIHEEINGGMRRETSGLAEASGSRFEEDFCLPERSGFLGSRGQNKTGSHSPYNRNAATLGHEKARDLQDAAMQVRLCAPYIFFLLQCKPNKQIICPFLGKSIP